MNKYITIAAVITIVTITTSHHHHLSPSSPLTIITCHHHHYRHHYCHLTIAFTVNVSLITCTGKPEQVSNCGSGGEVQVWWWSSVVVRGRCDDGQVWLWGAGVMMVKCGGEVQVWWWSSVDGEVQVLWWTSCYRHNASSHNLFYVFSIYCIRLCFLEAFNHIILRLTYLFCYFVAYWPRYCR